MILLTEDLLENQEMTSEQIASLRPALAQLLRKFRHCFGRDKTFTYLGAELKVSGTNGTAVCKHCVGMGLGFLQFGA